MNYEFLKGAIAATKFLSNSLDLKKHTTILHGRHVV